LKACEKCRLENSYLPRQACGAKKAAEGVVITVPVHSVYFAVYHRRSSPSVRLTGLRTFTAQKVCLDRDTNPGPLDTQNAKCTHANAQEHSSSARFTNIVQNDSLYICDFVKNTKFQMLVHVD